MSSKKKCDSKRQPKSKQNRLGMLLGATFIILTYIVLFVAPNPLGVDWTLWTGEGSALTLMALLLILVGVAVMLQALWNYIKACK